MNAKLFNLIAVGVVASASIATVGADGFRGSMIETLSIDPCLADIDNSGIVDVFDFAVLIGNYGLCGRVWGDFDLSGCVDAPDIDLFMEVFGESCDPD